MALECVYNGFGEVKQVKTYAEQGGSARITEYTYDKNGRVTAIDHPSPLGDEYFAYDDVGNLIGKKDGAAVVTAYEYDAANRLIKVDYNHTSWPPGTIGTADVIYTYVGGSRLRATMVDSMGTSEYDYDIHDRVTSYTAPSPANRVITYDYNNLNQKKWMELKENGTSKLKVTYAYFRNGWLKEVSRGTTPTSVATYTYDAVGNRTQVDYANDTYTVFDYDTDPRYRPDGITHYKDGSPPTELLDVTYPSRDGSGNPLTMVDADGTTEYDYDENSRLTDVTYPDDEEIAFGYDWVGNRLNLVPDTSTLEYNSADQLTRWPNHHQYEYYDTGSLSDQWDEGTNLQKYYTYTNANLLASVTHYDVQGDPLSEMEWDADGNRITLTISTGGTYYFVYDPTAGIPAVIEQNRLTSHHYYIREPGGELIARMTGTEPVLRYYHFDALGSTRLLTDDDGNVTDEYVYDAWGKLTDHTEHTGSVDQPFMFVGQLGYYTHYQDENLFAENDWQLLQLGVRFYDPELGRFTQVDPMLDGLSAYGYAHGSPTSGVDPTGMVFCPFRGSIGRLKVDSSCNVPGFTIRVLPERGDKHGGKTPDWGKWEDADGYVINGEEYKLDGSTCVILTCKVKCKTVTVIMNCWVNNLGGLRGSQCPYPFNWRDYP